MKENKFINKIGKFSKSCFVSVDGVDPRFKTIVKSNGVNSIVASIMAIILGLLAGFLIMLLVNPANAFAGFQKILQGGLSTGTRGIGNMLFYATPILMTGLSVGFAFKTGLFNIGATGQYTMGLFFSLLAGYYLEGGWVVCLLAGMLGGVLWGAIPGLFKAFLNVNEVITSIMTNYIGMYLVDMFIIKSSIMYNSEYGRTFPIPEHSNVPKMWLDKLLPNSYANGGIIIAILIAVVIYIVLTKTQLGFELRACGTNKNAAKYAGISEKNRIVLSMLIAGGLAGLGGALQIQSGVGNYYTPTNNLQPYGFSGIAVALLGTSNPIGIIFSAMFFAFIQQGGNSLQALSFSADIVDIIIGIIIYFSAFALIFKGYFAKLFANNNSSKPQKIAPISVDVANDLSISEHLPDKPIEEETTVDESNVSETTIKEEK